MKHYLIAAGILAFSAGVATAQSTPTANTEHQDGTHADHGTAKPGTKAPRTPPAPSPTPTPTPTPAPTPAPSPSPSPSPAPTSAAPVGPTQ